MAGLGAFAGVIWLVVVGSWFGNAYQMSNCDFEAPYKCEAIHAIGLLPALGVITVWSDTDE